jgi:hypothetical protein
MKINLALTAMMAVGTLLPLAAAQGAARDSRIYIPASCSADLAFKYKPRAMCVGNGLRIRRITWEAYGGKRAIARGQMFHNNCVPNCAEGTGAWVTTRFSVLRVRWACGKRIYTRMTGGPVGGGTFRLWVPGFDQCPR